MKNPIANLVSWQQNTGQLDGWTSYHLAAGAFLCKIFQWLQWSDFWCVMGVFIIGVLWEIYLTVLVKQKLNYFQGYIINTTMIIILFQNI